MAFDDLKDALGMFKSGVQDLQFSRALDNANEQVNQIKSSELDQQKQRAALQQVSNSLVGQMARFGVPETKMQLIAGSIGPKQYKNANEMAADANLTGNSALMNEAQQQQNFEQNPTNKIALIQAKMLMQDPLRQQIAEENQKQFNIKQFGEFSKDLDKSAASSRSGFGQWAQVEGRGQRLSSILGSPESWSQMTPEALELVKEGVVQMSKGGAMTQEEHKVLSPFMLKVKAAQAETAFTGKPTSVDFSGYAGLFNDIIKREGDAAKDNIKDTILTRATGKMKLSDRDPDQFKATIADRLNKQAGMNVSPDDILINKKTGVSIKQSSPNRQDTPQMTPVMVRDKNTGQMIKAMRGPDGKLYSAE